jgi:hypothetical protein
MKVIASWPAAGSRADSLDVAIALDAREVNPHRRDRAPLALRLHTCPAMRWLMGMVIAHFVVACYHPETRDCTLQCSAPTDCAGEQSCSSGWCASDGIRCTEEGQPITVDGSVNTDSSADADAANALCQQGCSKGTCMAGVCVIDCSADGACPNDVACPANLPCRVLCGDNACGHKIQCGTSSSCEVQCTGQMSCLDEIICPAGDCDVVCSGASSCKRRTKCANSCSCDVSCTGSLSCNEASECPESACRVGNGCSSTPTGCNTCS